MTIRPQLVLRITAGVVLLSSIGCTPAKLPGRSLGVYGVVGTLKSNECGNQAVPAANPLVFQVELRYDGQQAYWHREGLPAVAGAVTADGKFTFSIQTTWTAIPADPNFGYVGCFIAQQDTILGKVSLDDEEQSDAANDDAGVLNESWSGTEDIQMSPTAGSDCQAALLPLGGSFNQLPCGVHYDLLGTRLGKAGG